MGELTCRYQLQHQFRDAHWAYQLATSSSLQAHQSSSLDQLAMEQMLGFQSRLLMSLSPAHY